MSCLYVDHKCLSLPPPDPLNNATCRNPTNTVASIGDEELNGSWYVVKGWNPIYDCFDCQVSTFNVQDGQIDYHALYSFTAVNGTEIWLDAYMKGDDVTDPGELDFTTKDNGLPDAQNWFVMLLTDDTVVFYYCGNVNLGAWKFEGFIVLSRTKTLNPDREADISEIMAGLKIDEKDTCLLDPVNKCGGAPETYGLFTQ